MENQKQNSNINKHKNLKPFTMQEVFYYIKYWYDYKKLHKFIISLKMLNVNMTS